MVEEGREGKGGWHNIMYFFLSNLFESIDREMRESILDSHQKGEWRISCLMAGRRERERERE